MFISKRRVAMAGGFGKAVFAAAVLAGFVLAGAARAGDIGGGDIDPEGGPLDGAVQQVLVDGDLKFLFRGKVLEGIEDPERIYRWRGFPNDKNPKWFLLQFRSGSDCGGIGR